MEYSEASGAEGAWGACAQSGNAEWLASALRPRTRYRFRLHLQYVEGAPPYYWPQDDQFTYETLGISATDANLKLQIFVAL